MCGMACPAGLAGLAGLAGFSSTLERQGRQLVVEERGREDGVNKIREIRCCGRSVTYNVVSEGVSDFMLLTRGPGIGCGRRGCFSSCQTAVDVHDPVSC